MMATSQAFVYTGRNTSGKLVKGSLEAPSEVAVASRLVSLGLSPVSIARASEHSGLQKEISIPGFKKKIYG